MNSKKYPNICFPLILLFVQTAIPGKVSHAEPTLDDVKSMIANPGDGGSGPTIWFQSAREPNFGSAGEWAITTHGQLTDSRMDFFGNAEGAFGMAAGETRGGAISGVQGLGYAASPAGTLMITVQTGDDIDSIGSIFSRGEFVHDNPFEITVFRDDLRINYRVDSETKTGVTIMPVEPNSWYMVLIEWDVSREQDTLRWFVVDMGGGSANTGTLSPPIVGDLSRPIRVGGRASSAPFFGSLQNIAIYDRALSTDALTDLVDLFRSVNPFRESVQELLPDAFWVGPDDLYSHPVLGSFRTDEEIFPVIRHPLLGEVRLHATSDRETIVLNVDAKGFTDCATPAGWMLISAETAPYYFSMRHDSFVYVPGVVFDGGGFWLYDFSVGDWFAYGCDE